MKRAALFFASMRRRNDVRFDTKGKAVIKERKRKKKERREILELLRARTEIDKIWPNK